MNSQLLKRRISVEVIAECEEAKIAIIAWTSLNLCNGTTPELSASAAWCKGPTPSLTPRLHQGE